MTSAAERIQATIENCGSERSEAYVRNLKLKDKYRALERMSQEWERLTQDKKGSELDNANVETYEHRLDDPVARKLDLFFGYHSLFETVNQRETRAMVFGRVRDRIRDRNMKETEYHFWLNTPLKEIIKDARRGYRFWD